MMFGRMFSIVQMARCLVHSYPFFPHTTAIAEAAAVVVRSA
jgi:hypothetical protein